MEHTQGMTFRAEMPMVADAPVAVGERAYDEGVYVCTRCNVAGCEISLMPGDEAPECPHCGTDARWQKT